MPRRMTRLLVLVLVFSLVCSNVVPAMAQGDGQPLDLFVTLDEAGGWVLTVEGVEEPLRSQDVEVLASALGLGLPPLRLAPDMVSRATSNDIGYASLLKDDQDLTLYLDGDPVLSLGLQDEARSTLSGQLAPEFQPALAWIFDSDFGLSARFPGADAEPPPMESRITPVGAVGEAMNVVDLGLTISPDGELISVGGIDAQTFGMAGRLIDLTPYQDLIAQLNIATAGLDLVANSLGLSVNGAEWLRLALDLDFLEGNLGRLSNLAGFQLTDQMQQWIALGTDWLTDTEVHVAAYLATAPQEPPARLALDRPILVDVRGNSLYVEGINTGFALDVQTSSYLSRIGSLAFAWDGEERAIRSVVAQEPMPVIVLDEGFIATAGSTFVGEDVAPWQLVDAMMGNARLTGDLTYEDNPRSPVESLDYQVTTRTPPLGVTVPVTVSRSNGGVSVWGVSLPLSAFDPGVPEMIRGYANQYSALDTAVVDIGPAGAVVDLQGSQAHIRWDRQTRANAIGLAFDTFGPDLGLPPALTSDPARSALEAVVSFVNAFGVTVDVSVVDEDIQEGPLDRLLGLFN